MIAAPKLTQERAQVILNEVVRKMDGLFRWLSCSCRNELEFRLDLLLKQQKLSHALQPESYLYRSLENAAKKYFEKIGKHRKNERNNAELEIFPQKRKEFQRGLAQDVASLIANLSQRERDVLGTMMWGTPATIVARDFGVSDTTISKDKKRVIEISRKFLGAYENDRN